MTDDVTGSGTAQPEHNGSDFLGPTGPTDGHAAGRLLIDLLVPLEEICVSINPGFTAFTRMPFFTDSSAAVRVRP